MNLEPDPNPDPTPNNPSNLLETIILLGYNVRIGCRSNGQDIFQRQLQVSQKVSFVLVCFMSMALLCDEMILATFGMQL